MNLPYAQLDRINKSWEEEIEKTSDDRNEREFRERSLSAIRSAIHVIDKHTERCKRNISAFSNNSDYVRQCLLDGSRVDPEITDAVTTLPELPNAQHCYRTRTQTGTRKKLKLSDSWVRY